MESKEDKPVIREFIHVSPFPVSLLSGMTRPAGVVKSDEVKPHADESKDDDDKRVG